MSRRRWAKNLSRSNSTTISLMGAAGRDTALHYICRPSLGKAHSCPWCHMHGINAATYICSTGRTIKVQYCVLVISRMIQYLTSCFFACFNNQTFSVDFGKILLEVMLSH